MSGYLPSARGPEFTIERLALLLDIPESEVLTKALDKFHGKTRSDKKSQERIYRRAKAEALKPSFSIRNLTDNDVLLYIHEALDAMQNENYLPHLYLVIKETERGTTSFSKSIYYEGAEQVELRHGRKPGVNFWVVAAQYGEEQARRNVEAYLDGTHYDPREIDAWLLWVKRNFTID